MDSLYNENHILGRLFRKFMDLFPQATKPTKKLLALFLIVLLFADSCIIILVQQSFCSYGNYQKNILKIIINCVILIMQMIIILN